MDYIIGSYEFYLRIVVSFAVAFIVVRTIKSYEKKDNDYGVLTMPLSVVLMVLTVGGMVLMPYSGGSILNVCIRNLSLMAWVWMLMVISYMDQRCSHFQLEVLLKTALVELVLFAIEVCLRMLPLSFLYIIVFMVVCLVLFVMHLTGAFSIGDYFVFLVCECVYVIQCQSITAYFYVNMTALFVTLFSYMVRNLFRIRQALKKGKRMPFTMYIAVGAVLGLCFGPGFF